jgi:ABC-2 type transport system permease protein
MKSLLYKEFLGLWRTRRVLIVFATMFVFGLLGPISVKYMPTILSSMPGVPAGLDEIMPDPDVVLAIDEFVQNSTQFGVILSILVPMGAVVNEKGRGTVAVILSKPVSRISFLAAKWVAYSAIFFGGAILAGLGGYYYLGVLFEWLSPVGFLALVGLMAVYLLMFVMISIFASTITKSQLGAAGLSFGVMIVLGILSVLPAVSPYLPASMLQWGRALALGQEVDGAWGTLLVSVLVMAAACLGSWVVFRRQEL